MKKMSKSIKRKGFAVIIASVVVVFLIIIVFMGSAAIIGDHKGAGDTGEMITEASAPGFVATTTGPASGVCSNVLANAQTYFGLSYSQKQPHCGSNTAGKTGVQWLDCSGFTSRVYRDSGLAPASGWCLSTGTIPSASFLTKVTGNINEAKTMAQPGDLILMDGHVVMYAGEAAKNIQLIYASRGKDAGGPQEYPARIWNTASRRGFLGLYRSKSCSGPVVAKVVNNKTVTIDPGHPSDVGKGTSNSSTNIKEVQVVYDIALKTKAILESKGYKVIMTKSSVNQRVTNQRRAEIANESGSSAFVRIHLNSGDYAGSFVEYPDRTGTYKGKTGPPASVLAPSKKLSETLAKTIKSATGLKSQGAKTEASVSTTNESIKQAGVLVGSLYTEVPTGTIEVIGINTSATNARWVADSTNQQKVATGIANGIIEFLSSK
jgi:N-acetylmuramoyl-L-alanine amidase